MAGPFTAQVALPVPVSRIFSYRLPSDLEATCLPGCRVKVPFGGKVLVGVVVGRDPEGEAREGLRDIQELLDPAPRLSEELLAFTKWISEYYFAPWGLVLQAALPSALSARTRRSLEVSREGMGILENPFSEISARERQVLDLLVRKGPVASQRLRALLPSANPAMLSRLESRGWIRALESAGNPPGGPRFQEWALSGPSPLSGEDPALGRGQKRLLVALDRAGGAMPSASLLREAGAARSSLLALSRRHAVVLEKRPPVPPAAAGDLPPEAPPLLTPHQRVAAGALEASLAQGGYRCFLLEGVTGSGKTEIYLDAAARFMALGMGVLYLVPEIGLTPLLAGRLERRFPGRIALLHSGLGEKARREEWERIHRGEVSLILGTRSALFAPHPRIGLFIVDEEQDVSYYQAESPRYHARDAILVRARRLQATVVLGSATPSLESIASVRRRRFQLLSLPERVARRPLPEVRLIDMREEFLQTGLQSLLSRELAEGVRRLRAEGSQALLLLNRRGFSTFVLCRACGHRLVCPRCTIALTYHRDEEKLCCHYCNSRRRVPGSCPECRSPHLHRGGAGTQKLEEAIRILDPGLRIARLDRDTAGGRKHETLLRSFENGEIDLMLGTQMLAKGHDFPGVTLVGILSADAHLALPDFRAAERTYQLLAQAAGRAGRGDRPGRVLIQAFDTEHPALRAAARHSPEEFYDRELHLRRVMGYPPWVALTQVRIQDRNGPRGEVSARRVAQRLRAGARDRYAVLGPAPAPFSKLRGEYRYQILLKGKSRRALAEGIRETLRDLEASRALPGGLVVETDPRSLL